MLTVLFRSLVIGLLVGALGQLALDPLSLKLLYLRRPTTPGKLPR